MFLGRVPRNLFAAFLWVLLVCWAGTILWLSSHTPDQLPSLSIMMSWDKAAHFVAFSMGGWLAATALLAGGGEGGRRGRIVKAIVIIAVFGALDETRQLFTPGRSGADLYDWIADFLGACAGAILSLYTYGFLARRLTSA